MNWKKYAFAGLVLIASCARAENAAPLYVDVRSADEFAAGHVRGAVNIPQDQLADRWQELAAYQDAPIVVYCRSGRRSALALETLMSKGFTRVQDGGALDGLVARGVPTESGP